MRIQTNESLTMSTGQGSKRIAGITGKKTDFKLRSQTEGRGLDERRVCAPRGKTEQPVTHARNPKPN